MKTLAVLLTLTVSFANFAQDEIIVIDRGNSNYRKDKHREIKLNDNIQVIKFAPLNLLAGEILFGYERQFGVKGSIDLELGPTISKIGFGIDNHYVSAYEPSVDDLSGLGFVTGVSYRYYPLDETEALNRFYVAPQFRFKLYNHHVQDFSGFLPGTMKGNEVNSNFYFNFGYQVWVSKTFCLDFYTGLGIGMQSVRDYSAENYFADNMWQYRWREDFSSGARYIFQMGLKVGIGSE